MNLPYLAFVIFLSNEYESYPLTFQSEKPLIHMLLDGMSMLLTNILKHFVNKKFLVDTKDGVSKIKPIHDLVKLSLVKKSSFKIY